MSEFKKVKRAQMELWIARAPKFSCTKLFAVAALREDFRSFVQQFGCITLHQAQLLLDTEIASLSSR
jgi:hypothetical protein